MSGYEQPRIPGGGEHTDSWEHPDIKSAFEPLDTTEAVNQAQKYWEVHQLWEQGLATFARSIQASISQAWAGPAAEQAKASIQRYTEDARLLSPALAEMYTRVRDAANAIVDTKKAIPDPVEVGWTTWAWPPRRWDLQREQSEAAQVARAEMRQRYVVPFGQVDGQIPVLPTPIGPTVSPDIAAPPPGGYVDSGTGAGAPSTTARTQSPASGEPAATTPGAGEGAADESPEQAASGEEQPTGPAGTTSDDTTPAASTTTQPSTADPGPRTTTDPGRTVPAGTVPASTVPASATPASATPASGVPGYTPGTAPERTTPAPGGPDQPGRNQPDPGRSVPGSPAAASPAAAAAAAQAARGTTGTPGVFAPGAARGRGAEDAEHKRPDYLVNQENADELLGEVPRTVAGGVIGGDDVDRLR